MCGLAGAFGIDSDRILYSLSDRLKHRGPDGDGLFFDPEARVGLVHRRLAIIDQTTAAAQPMASADGRYQVVFNGEIYNFKDLAAELTGLGYQLNTNSDTAVIAPLYHRLGLDFISRLNGIFAIAIWDSQEQELIVARDAMGIKPLYYAEQDGAFLFASELKALAPELRDHSLDPRAILDYLTYLWSPGKATPFASIRKLLPGHLVRVNRRGIEFVRWHREPAPPRRNGEIADAEASAAVMAAFDRAVERQCISDVPIGAFLSGGVDSSAIVAAMGATGNRPKRAYCIAFDGASMNGEGFGDDVVFARQMAARLDVELSVITVAQPKPEDIANLPFLLDEPTADPAALYVAAIAQAARADGIKVLLGGTGGDDIFSGYRRHRAAALRQRLGPLARIGPLPIATALGGNGPLARRLAKLGYMLAGTEEEFLVRAFEFNRRGEVLGCLTPEFADAARSAGDGQLEEVARRNPSASLLDRMLLLERHGFLPDHNLNYTDKAAMAHGVEVRVPFLDDDLVALADSLPWRMKMRGTREKWILKQAMRQRLPANVLDRKKTGFGAPVRAWVTGGPLRSLIADTISSRSFQDRGVLSRSQVASVLDDTVAGRKDGAYLVLACVVLEHWMRSFADAALSPADGARQSSPAPVSIPG